MAEAILQRLRELGEEYNLRDPRKLLQIAQRQGVAGATSALAKEALALDVGRQILRPPPRATGRAAATRPDSTLQADLIDFSNNLPPTSQGNRYAVVLGDVFTRELRAVPIPSKDPGTVARALRPMIENLTEGDQNFTLSRRRVHAPGPAGGGRTQAEGRQAGPGNHRQRHTEPEEGTRVQGGLK